MSDKTLVERLREEAKTARDERGLPVYTPEKIEKLADAIEREDVPRPRYEDGEPIQFGDIYTDKNGREWKNGIKSIHIDCNGDFSLHDNTIGHVGRYEVFGQDRRVKRHRPDSLERIEEDAGKLTCEYFNRDFGDCENCKGFGGCHEKMALDLLRRQREVLEKTHGQACQR